jgi:hypothetical protein
VRRHYDTGPAGGAAAATDGALGLDEAD